MKNKIDKVLSVLIIVLFISLMIAIFAGLGILLRRIYHEAGIEVAILCACIGVATLGFVFDCIFDLKSIGLCKGVHYDF
ncbi:MAG: hypothetical protein IJN85_04840 [Oscillospiraceae bacterium]|nr:hypothetical protein [Oscillospiraceae bacterium]